MHSTATRILFLPNWHVRRLAHDDDRVQAPDKVVEGDDRGYWFFRHFRRKVEVDVLDIGRENWWRKLEHKIKFYIAQPLKAFMRRNRYDVVVSHGAQSGLVYELLATFASKKPLHVMIDVGGLNGARINMIETPLIKFAMRKSPVIIVHSSRQLQLYRDHYPNLAPKAHFVPFGTDFDFFSEHLHSDDIPTDHVLLSVGYAKRDYSTLCQAWKQASVGHFKLCIVGDTSLAEQYSDCPSIEFSERIPIAELMSLTRRCTAVVVPLPEFLYSYGQMTILQSMAMGKPMIVTRTTSTADYIDHDPGVMAVQPHDVGALSQALERMCGLSQEELQLMGKHNMAHVREHFNEQSMAEKIEKIITKHMIKK